MDQIAEEKKRAIIRHINGEIEIFNESYERLNTNPKEPSRRIILESFLLHARNLFDFLCTKKSHDDDVSVADFLIDCFKLSEEDVPIVKINKQLSHITYARLNPEDLFEKRKTIYETIKAVLVEYNKKVLEEYQLKYIE